MAVQDGFSYDSASTGDGTTFPNNPSGLSIGWGQPGVAFVGQTGFIQVARSIRSPIMQEVKQSTAVNVRVTMRSLSDGLPVANLQGVMTVGICKNGLNTFTTIAPVITNLGNGTYDLALTASHTDTLGVASLRVTAPDMVPNDDLTLNVVSATSNEITTLLLANVTLLSTTDAIRKASYNRWKIIGTQLIIYDDDGTTPLETFDLKDSEGNASSSQVFERVPVP